MLPALVALISLFATTAVAKIGPDAVYMCAKARSQGRMYPDPDDCRKFIRCVSRKPVSFTCPPNTAFDPDTQVCAWRVGKNGCGGKLAPTTWMGMIDNLINDISQKDDAVEEKVGSNGLEKLQTKINQVDSWKQPQKYMVVDKSSQEKQGKAVTTTAKVSSSSNADKVKSVQWTQRKTEYVPPQKTSSSPSQTASEKSKYKSYKGQKATKSFLKSAPTTGKPKTENRPQALNKSETNITEILNASRSDLNSLYNNTKIFPVNESSYGVGKDKANTNKTNGLKISSKPSLSISAPAVKALPTRVTEVKAEAYMSNVKDAFARVNGSLRSSENQTLNLTSSSAATEMPRMLSNRSFINESAVRNDDNSTAMINNSNTFFKQNGSNDVLSPVNGNNISAVSKGTEIAYNRVNSSSTRNLYADDAPISSNTSDDKPRWLSPQRQAKQGSSRGAMMKPTQITMYVPKSALSKKYSSSPRVDFYPVPQPYRAVLEPRGSIKYSKMQDDVMTTTEPPMNSQVNNITTSSANEADKPEGTVVSTASGIDTSKLSALKDILKYMTGKIVDRSQYLEERPKTKRWYDNDNGDKTVISTEINENNTSSSAISDEDNAVDQYSDMETGPLLQKKEKTAMTYSKASNQIKVQTFMSPFLSDNATATSTNLTNVTSPASSFGDAPADVKPAAENVSFKSSPYMVKGLLREFKCPQPNGHFADPKDCSVYYHCAGGVAYRRDCMTGQVFLPEAASCVSANLAPPCIQAFSNKVEMDKDFAKSVCVDPNGLYRDTFSCAHYFECTNGWPIRRKCMPGTVFDEARGRCTWSKYVPGCEGGMSVEIGTTESGMKEKFECPRDGYFRDESDCGVYFLCAAGESLRMTCEQGTSFDINLNMCVWTYLVEGCEDRSSNMVVSGETDKMGPSARMSDDQKMIDFSCPEENGVFPDPEDCGTYYTCIDDVAKRLLCPFGTGYDDVTSLCIDSRQVPRCINPKKSKYETSKSNLVLQPFVCPRHHGLYADQYNCSRFIHCFNNTAYRHDCMPGTAFSTEKGLCTWRHLVPECNMDIQIVPHTATTPAPITATHTVSTSAHGKMTTTTPPMVEYQRKEPLMVRSAAASPEPMVPSEPYQANHDDASEQHGIQDFQCPSVLDGFYRDNLFCDIFHRCVLGTRFTFTCPTGTFFRMEGNLCDFWETVTDCTQDGIRIEAFNSLPETAPEPSPLPVPQPVPVEVEVNVVSMDTDPTPCPASSGLFAHPRNCKQFLFCAHHVPLVLTCPETLLYNPQTLTCDFAKNVQCVRYDHLRK